MEKNPQGDAIKTSTEVVRLAADAEYIGFIHDYNLNGQFIIPILTPMMKTSAKVNDKIRIAPIKGTKMKYASTITRTNYVEVPIPLHLVWEYVVRSSIRNFTTNSYDTNLYIQVEIPKGTEFVISFVGEDVNKIRILGINKRY